MKPQRIVFAGTPHFAVPCLQAALRSGHEVVGVYTQPDRPAGRGRELVPSAVKVLAQQCNVPVFQPGDFKSPEARAQLEALKPDLMIVVAYGMILPRSVLRIPRLGCWNVHASLLPRWRGAAPIQRALLAGDTRTGVCLMKMEAGLDTGPVMISLETPIAPDDTTGTLHNRLATLGAQLVEDALKLLRVGLSPAAQPQAADGVTYARKMEKAEARLDLALPAVELERAVRAFYPWPVAELQLEGERLRVHQAEVVADAPAAAPGTLLEADRRGILLATGAGGLRLLRVQREGGRPVGAADYLNARPLAVNAPRTS
ncbi:MAG TPA: methionyl-tRNA formyltransferase [Pseudomonadota bacterium]|nr:methionyl-tRNA formyltransferase [Xanthomonadales bacterium]MBP8176900.1 methionyl-tRNA formyltransferase [Xanthomonadales bacterium]HQX24412.1 methionyl-tRNA formyltransferase [Pseudomonadota bacterium]HQY36305.1 methionyl-tRNA formyltransferase [Pseudomonadota bacterium]HRA36528.1 methionyl-tRNA formyltransferase [Pseudomonadota bacterium]